MQQGFVATYRGVTYPANIGPGDGDVVLFSDSEPPADHGFERTAAYWRKPVPRTEITALEYLRTVGTYRGEPCLVLGDRGERVHIAFLGHDAPHAEELGYWMVDRGAYEVVVAAPEVTDITTDHTPLPAGGPAPTGVPAPGEAPSGAYPAMTGGLAPAPAAGGASGYDAAAYGEPPSGEYPSVPAGMPATDVPVARGEWTSGDRLVSDEMVGDDAIPSWDRPAPRRQAVAAANTPGAVRGFGGAVQEPAFDAAPSGLSNGHAASAYASGPQDPVAAPADFGAGHDMNGWGAGAAAAFGGDPAGNGSGFEAGAGHPDPASGNGAAPAADRDRPAFGGAAGTAGFPDGMGPAATTDAPSDAAGQGPDGPAGRTGTSPLPSVAPFADEAPAPGTGPGPSTGAWPAARADGPDTGARPAAFPPPPGQVPDGYPAEPRPGEYPGAFPAGQVPDGAFGARPGEPGPDAFTSGRGRDGGYTDQPGGPGAVAGPDTGFGARPDDPGRPGFGDGPGGRAGADGDRGVPGDGVPGDGGRGDWRDPAPGGPLGELVEDTAGALAGPRNAPSGPQRPHPSGGQPGDQGAWPPPPTGQDAPGDAPAAYGPPPAGREGRLDTHSPAAPASGGYADAAGSEAGVAHPQSFASRGPGPNAPVPGAPQSPGPWHGEPLGAPVADREPRPIDDAPAWASDARGGENATLPPADRPGADPTGTRDDTGDDAHVPRPFWVPDTGADRGERPSHDMDTPPGDPSLQALHDLGRPQPPDFGQAPATDPRGPADAGDPRPPQDADGVPGGTPPGDGPAYLPDGHADGSGRVPDAGLGRFDAFGAAAPAPGFGLPQETGPGGQDGHGMANGTDREWRSSVEPGPWDGRPEAGQVPGAEHATGFAGYEPGPRPGSGFDPAGDDRGRPVTPEPDRSPGLPPDGGLGARRPEPIESTQTWTPVWDDEPAGAAGEPPWPGTPGWAGAAAGEQHTRPAGESGDDPDLQALHDLGRPHPPDFGQAPAAAGPPPTGLGPLPGQPLDRPAGEGFVPGQGPAGDAGPPPDPGAPGPAPVDSTQTFTPVWDDEDDGAANNARSPRTTDSWAFDSDTGTVHRAPARPAPGPGPATGIEHPDGHRPPLGWEDAQPVAFGDREPQARPAERDDQARISPRWAFGDLVERAGIADGEYAVEEEVEGAFCLITADDGYDVFYSEHGGRHNLQHFDDEQAAFYYLFGRLAAVAVRSGRLTS